MVVEHTLLEVNCTLPTSAAGIQSWALLGTQSHSSSCHQVGGTMNGFSEVVAHLVLVVEPPSLKLENSVEALSF